MMETQRDNTQQNRKRTRDQQGEDKKESNKGKKPEFNLLDDSFCKENGYEFCDGIGVFDFPWLKDGVIYKGEEYFEPEDTFPPFPNPDEVSPTFAISNLDQPCVQNLHVPPPINDSNLHENKFGDDNFWSSFQVDDDLDIDCIWSSVIDQPLDAVGLNKA